MRYHDNHHEQDQTVFTQEGLANLSSDEQGNEFQQDDYEEENSNEIWQEDHEKEINHHPRRRKRYTNYLTSNFKRNLIVNDNIYDDSEVNENGSSESKSQNLLNKDYNDIAEIFEDYSCPSFISFQEIYNTQSTNNNRSS